MNAITKEYGVSEGFSTKDGVITKWPYAATQPSQQEFDDLLEIYDTKKSKEIEINNQRDIALLDDLTLTIDSGGSVEVEVTKDTFFTLQPLIESGTSVKWVLKNNTTATFITVDFITFRNALIARNNEIYQARKRKNAINALTTVTAVEAYDITKIYV